MRWVDGLSPTAHSPVGEGIERASHLDGLPHSISFGAWELLEVGRRAEDREHGVVPMRCVSRRCLTLRVRSSDGMAAAYLRLLA